MRTKTAELPDGTPYTIRPLRDGDLSEVCDLYGQMRSATPSREWLHWKFHSNPHSSGVSMFVADGRDGIFGIRPFIRVRIGAGTDTYDAVCFVNAFIRPEYRGKGVFSALSDVAFSYVTPRNDLLFCFTNENSAPIYRHWGWNEVRTEITHFRLHDPASVVGNTRSWLDAVLNPLFSTRVHLAPFEIYSNPETDIQIKRCTEIPYSDLESLYRRSMPDRLHVVRDEPYYRWRLGDPETEWELYIALGDGDQIGGMITRSWSPMDRYTRIDIEDALFPKDHSLRGAAMSKLLLHILSVNGAHDVVAVPDMLLPRELLRSNGFIATDWPLVSTLYRQFFTELTLFVKPISELQIPVTDPENWLVSSLIRTTN